MTRPACAIPLLMLPLLLAACGGGGPQSRADAAAQTDCRQRANQAYERQNRDAPYRDDAFENRTKDSPYASSGLARDYSRNLAADYQVDNDVQKCLQGIGQPPATDIQVGKPVGKP